ncbi:MAG: methyltransferase domain-containing protein [Chloroflexi bacterium]|jgi:ubiquinone/menaquinone biosynthesis C-methylase UbiE|nr:methyltransferase domain-containing protein [Chloroflexota bacterium]
MKNTERFSSKANFYAQHRWGYHAQAFDTILAQLPNPATCVVADIGAGGGEVSRHLIGRVKQVIAIEPNPEMRSFANQRLGQHPAFSLLAAPAEFTALRDASVDLITVGRAIHWFQPELARAEFRRILKPKGLLCILRLPALPCPLSEATQALQTAEFGWDTATRQNRNLSTFENYFCKTPPKNQTWQGEITEDWEQFWGRLRSLSVAPDETHSKYISFKTAAQTIFNTHSINGKVSIPYATEVFIGSVIC